MYQRFCAIQNLYSPTKVVTFAHRSTVLVIYVFYGESISTVETQLSHYSMTTQFTLKDKVRLRRNEKRTGQASSVIDIFIFRLCKSIGGRAGGIKVVQGYTVLPGYTKYSLSVLSCNYFCWSTLKRSVSYFINFFLFLLYKQIETFIIFDLWVFKATTAQCDHKTCKWFNFIFCFVHFIQ
jgi:hypothetical protein